MIVVLMLASIAIGLTTAVMLWPHGILWALIAGPVVTSLLVLCGAVLIAYRDSGEDAAPKPFAQAFQAVLSKIGRR
ncbi:MAG: hypothetical protein QM722_00620 [Piscinibacter sp.]